MICISPMGESAQSYIESTIPPAISIHTVHDQLNPLVLMIHIDLCRKTRQVSIGVHYKLISCLSHRANTNYFAITH